jgi:two-component system response regulator DevR
MKSRRDQRGGRQRPSPLRASLALGASTAGRLGGCRSGCFFSTTTSLSAAASETCCGSKTDVTVVGEAATAEEALAKISLTKPDVAVLDVRLGDDPSTMSGIELCREIRSAHPEVACVMLTSFADDEALLASMMAGAAGYVLKQIHGVDLVAAIRRVAAGQGLLDPALAARVSEQLRAPRHDQDPLAALTRQERRILDLIAEETTNREIGEAMDLAEKTVKNYVSHLLTKMGMERRSEAAAYAARLAEQHKGAP